VYKSFPPGVHSINWDTANRVELVVIDEPGAFPPALWKAELAFNARGRASGLMSVLATQRPSSKIMDTDLRALYQIRHGHRLEDAGMLMTLGDSYRGFSAKDFGPDRPGECWLVPNDRTPVRCRSFWLTDSDLANVAERARVLRAKSAAPTDSAPNDLPQDDPQDVPDTPPGLVLPRLQIVPAASKTVPVRKLALSGSDPADKLRLVLQAVADLGPEVPGPGLMTALGIGSDVLSRRGGQLLGAGYVQRARKQPSDGPSRGASSPWLWTVTEDGKKILEALNASRNERVAQPKEAGAQ
jgi:hypothetical protein